MNWNSNNINPTYSLGSLFVDSEDENDENNENDDNNNNKFQQNYEDMHVIICNKTLIIRQFCWHAGNANKIWPGTFNLASFLMNIF